MYVLMCKKGQVLPQLGPPGRSTFQIKTSDRDQWPNVLTKSFRLGLNNINHMFYYPHEQPQPPPWRSTDFIMCLGVLQWITR